MPDRRGRWFDLLVPLGVPFLRRSRPVFVPWSGAQNGRGVRRGSAKRAPLLNPCLPARAGGEPPQWENQTDKGVVRPAARSARTRPRRTCSIFVLRWGTSGPQTDGRAAPGPTRAGGVWLDQIPPASRSPRLARGSRYSERGRGGSVPQLPQAAPGCPQALARSLASRAGLLRSRAFTPKVVPGARLDNRVRPASAVPPVRDEMGGAGRPGPVCGGMARRDIQPCSAAGRIAPTSSGGGRYSRPEPGARPEGDARMTKLTLQKKQEQLYSNICFIFNLKFGF